MCMDHRLHIWPLAVNRQVHANFTGHVAAFADAMAFHVDHYHVRCLEQELAHAGGGGEDAVVAWAHREVPRRAGYEAQSIQPLTETGKLLAVKGFSGPLGSGGA